jgi:hypothetical protein
MPSLLIIWYVYSSEAYAREQTQIVRKIVSEHNGSDFVFAEEPEAKKELWKVVILYYVKIMPPSLPKLLRMLVVYDLLHQREIHALLTWLRFWRQFLKVTVLLP